MRVIAIACVLLAYFASAGSQAQGASSPVRDVADQALAASEAVEGPAPALSPLFGMVDFVPQTILDYCKSAAPEIRAELTDEAARFKERSHRAVAPYVDRLALDGATAPGPSGMELNNMKQMMLASLAKNEPHRFCSAYVVKLRDADVEALAADAWSKYQAVMAAPKAHNVK